MCSIFGTSHPLRPLDYGHHFDARGCCCLLVYCPLVGMEKMVESFFGACSFVWWRTQKRILREVTCLRCGGSSENKSPPITQSRKARQSFAQDGQKGRACINGEVQTQRAGSRTTLGTWRMSSSRPRQEICLAVRMQGRMCEPSGTCGSRDALVLALRV